MLRFARNDEKYSAFPARAVKPANAGIQYAADSRFNHCRLWDTGIARLRGR